MPARTFNTPNKPSVTDRRSSQGDQLPPDEERQARIVARAAALVLGNAQPAPRAPGIRTADTRSRYTKRDYDSMALDAGMSAAAMDQRHQSEEEFRMVLRGDRRFSKQQEAQREEIRAERRRAAGLGVRRKQFTEMRGRRHTFTTQRQAASLEQLLSRGPDGIHIGEADHSFLVENSIGDLVSSWAGYLVKSSDGQRLDPMAAARMAFEAGESDRLVRTLGEASGAAGGVLVPDEVSEDYIELLYAATVFLQGGPVRMSLANGVLTLPRGATGATVGWIGENANIGKSAPTFDAPQIVLRYMAGLVPHSNRLALHSPQSVAQIVMEDLIAGAGVLIDLAAIRGTGTAFQPLGIENQVPVGNKKNQSGTTVPAITTDTGALQRYLEDAKIPRVRPYWIMAPRTRWALMTARDGNNNLVWAEEMARGTFQGAPFGVTTSVPINLGGGTNESKLYHLEMTQEIYAEGVGPDAMRFDSRDGVAYHDGSTVISAFSQDQTVSRLIQSADIVSRRNGLNIAMLEAVTIA